MVGRKAGRAYSHAHVCGVWCVVYGVWWRGGGGGAVLRAEHHRDGIAVTLVTPGYVDTDLAANALTAGQTLRVDPITTSGTADRVRPRFFCHPP